MLRKLLLCTALLSAVIVPVMSPAFAADVDQINAEAADISREVMSPFCPGRTLHDCPSSSASELKQKIKDKVQAGESRSQIMEFLVSLYGSEVRATPEAEGFGALAWVMPFLFLGVGGVVWMLWLEKKRSTVPDLAAPAKKLTPELESRIERELRKT